MPLKQELFIIVSPVVNLFSSSPIDFASESEPSTIRPRKRTGEECIDGIYEEKSVGVDRGVTENGVVFTDLPFISIMLLDLRGQKLILAHVKAVVHRFRSF